jgi:hypothetical protein
MRCVFGASSVILGVIARRWAITACCAMACIAAPLAWAGEPGLRISAVYVGGGLQASGGVPASTFSHDVIELHNAGALDVQLSGWMLHAAPGFTGNWVSYITLPARVVPPGGFVLVRANSALASAGGAIVPAPDVLATGDRVGGGPEAINLTALGTSSSRLVLSRPGAAVALHAVSNVTNPLLDTRFAPFVADLVGIGASALAFEGAGPAPQPGAAPGTFTTTHVLVRREAGCVDSDNNAADFVVQPLSATVLRNSASEALVCVPACGSIDFNGDGLFPDDSDLVDFLVVLAGGACSTEPAFACGTIDFNNDGLFPDDSDLLAFLRVLAGGAC